MSEAPAKSDSRSAEIQSVGHVTVCPKGLRIGGKEDIMAFMRNVLVLYGGVSTEHEVSIVTALQVMHALKGAGHKVLPIYVSKSGEWYLGGDKFLEPSFYQNLNNPVKDGKRVVLPPDRELKLLGKGMMGFGGVAEEIEVVFPVFHGKNGEDGTMQGLVELTGLPLVGCGVGASALGMDKYLAKRVAKDLGIEVVEDVLVSEEEWGVNKKGLLNEIDKLGRDVFVKPNSLGSSIGITRAKNKSELVNAIEVALAYDSRVLVEKAVKDMVEVNISIKGNDPYQVSITEQPLASGEVLSFEDKYIKPGGKKSGKTHGMAAADRLMPARVDKKIIKAVDEAAIRFFRAIGGKGIARVDFMYDGKRLYFNEINTMPGSLAFYLWEKTGVKFDKLVDELVELAVSDWHKKQKKVTTFESNILSGFAKGGVKS